MFIDISHQIKNEALQSPVTQLADVGYMDRTIVEVPICNSKRSSNLR